MSRRRAPQQEHEPGVVLTATVNSREMAQCPIHSWASVHWIPEHAIEECQPEARAVMRHFDEQTSITRRDLYAWVDRALALGRERKIRELRDTYGGKPATAATTGGNDGTEDHDRDQHRQ